MRKQLRLFMGCLTAALSLAASSLRADVTVGVDPGASWIGFMNVFELPSNGGAYVFGSGWGVADLCATFSGPILTLTPNTIGDPNPFWYTPSGGPGATGNKTMDASMYVETTGVFTGQTLSFTGSVLANTLVSPYTSVAFIKDFAPDYSSSISITAPMVNGVFNISLATINDPSRHIQYGFETIGPDVWITDVASKGLVQITAVPEPSFVALAMAGIVGWMIRKRNTTRV
jgi:hypothetical protein